MVIAQPQKHPKKQKTSKDYKTNDTLCCNTLYLLLGGGPGHVMVRITDRVEGDDFGDDGGD